MPKVVEEMTNGGHDFKTSLMESFEKFVNYKNCFMGRDGCSSPV